MKATQEDVDRWKAAGMPYSIGGSRCDGCTNPLSYLIHRGSDGKEYCSKACRDTHDGTTPAPKKTGANNKMKNPSENKATKAPLVSDADAKSTDAKPAKAADTKPDAAPAKKKSKPDAAPAKKTKTAAPSAKPAKKAAKKAAKKPDAKAKAKPAGKKPGVSGAHEYRPGSAQGLMFDCLRDGKWHTYDDLAALVPETKKTRDCLWFIKKHGNESGKWKLERSADKKSFRLVFNKK